MAIQDAFKYRKPLPKELEDKVADESASENLVQEYMDSNPDAAYDSRFRALQDLIQPNNTNPAVEVASNIAPSQMPLTPSASLAPEQAEEQYLSNAKLAAMGAQMPVGGLPVDDQPPVVAPIKSPVEAPVEPQDESPVSRLMSALGGQRVDRQSLVDAAQEERRKRMMLADADRLSNIISEGFVTSSGMRKFDPDLTRAAELQKRADMPTQELQEDMELKPEEQRQDPNSDISIQYRELAKKLLGGKVPEGFDSLSADQLQSALPMLQQMASTERSGQLTPYQQRMLDLQERKLDQYNEGEERRIAQQDLREQKTYLDSARSLIKDDPRFKKAVEQGMEFENVDLLIKQAAAGNQNALAALGTKLARAMGEVGVLTDTDVVRYVQGQSWGRKLQDWAKRGFEGELSEDTLRDMQQNLGLLKGKLAGDVNRVYSKASSRMKTAYPQLDEKLISGLIGMPVTESPDVDEKVVVEKDGKQFRLPKAQLNRAVKQGYKEVK